MGFFQVRYQEEVAGSKRDNTETSRCFSGFQSNQLKMHGTNCLQRQISTNVLSGPSFQGWEGAEAGMDTSLGVNRSPCSPHVPALLPKVKGPSRKLV